MLTESFPQAEWKVPASTRKHTQAEPEEEPGFQMLPRQLLAKKSFNQCLADAVLYSGCELQEIAQAMHVSPGYMSRFMQALAQHWARRMVLFMRKTRHLGPLQKLCDEMGGDFVPRAPLESEIDRLRRENAELRRGRNG